MYKQKTGISIGRKDLLSMIKSIGFEAVSGEWSSYTDLEEYVKTARELPLEIQSLHAPFGGAAKMWSRDESVSAPIKNELLKVIDACADFNIPIMVAHTWIGFEYEFKKDDLFFDNYDALVRRAEEKNVKIAFENTEGIEYLTALMERYENNEAVGFCWDSGHEMCYNGSADLLALYGDRLIATHLNDNLGVRDFGGRIFWHDDLHLLPFDGIADWDYNAARLDKCGFDGIMTFELNLSSKPDRHENDIYRRMTIEEYVAEAYKRACRVAAKRKIKKI